MVCIPSKTEHVDIPAACIGEHTLCVEISTHGKLVIEVASQLGRVMTDRTVRPSVNESYKKDTNESMHEPSIGEAPNPGAIHPQRNLDTPFEHIAVACIDGTPPLVVCPAWTKRQHDDALAMLSGFGAYPDTGPT